MTSPAMRCQTTPSESSSGPGSSLTHVNDLTVASAVARAIRDMPGVVDLSSGPFAQVATFGSGQRVSGVSIRYTTSDEVMLEVHVILSARLSKLPKVDAAPDQASPDTCGQGVLTDFAGEIRAVVYRTVRDMGVRTLAGVDVLVDDLH